MYQNLKEENDEEDSRLGEEQDQKQDCWRRWSLWHCLIGFSDRNPNRPFFSPQRVYLASPERIKPFSKVSIEINRIKGGTGQLAPHRYNHLLCIKTAGRLKSNGKKCTR